MFFVVGGELTMEYGRGRKKNIDPHSMFRNLVKYGDLGGESHPKNPLSGLGTNSNLQLFSQ